MDASDKKDNNLVQSMIDEHSLALCMAPEVLYYSLLCGLFTPERQILYNWKHNKTIFEQLQKNDAKPDFLF